LLGKYVFIWVWFDFGGFLELSCAQAEQRVIFVVQFIPVVLGMAMGLCTPNLNEEKKNKIMQQNEKEKTAKKLF